MATNHLGHFALTGLLLDRIVTTERSRVVTVSSHMHRLGRLDLDDVAGTTPRNTWVTYGTSKLANLLFTAELSRRLAAGGRPTRPWPPTRAGPAATWPATAPPWATAGCGASSGGPPARRSGSPPRPARCPSSAPPPRSPCTPGSTSARRGLFELFGPPRVARPSAPGPRRRGRGRLWTASEELTGVRYSVGAPV